MRGLPVSAVQREHIVQVWFGSPTGDSSDSILLDIPCHNADQARGLADEYSKFIKGIYPVYEISETTQKVLNGLMENISLLKQEVSELRNCDKAHIEEISEMKEKLDMYKFAYDSQRVLITQLKEQLNGQWFDQTVSF